MQSGIKIDQKIVSNIYKRSYFLELNNVYAEKDTRAEVIRKHIKIIAEEVNNAHQTD